MAETALNFFLLNSTNSGKNLSTVYKQTIKLVFNKNKYHNCIFNKEVECASVFC